MAPWYEATRAPHSGGAVSVARPALATERLHERTDRRLEYELRHRWWDGPMAVVLQPRALLLRLAMLVPPPRALLLTLADVLAPASALRSVIVPAEAARRRPRCGLASVSPEQRPTRRPWAELLRRVFGREVLRCTSCGSRRRIVAAFMQRAAIRAILESLALPAQGAVVVAARAPPELPWGAVTKGAGPELDSWHECVQAAARRGGRGAGQRVAGKARWEGTPRVALRLRGARGCAEGTSGEGSVFKGGRDGCGARENFMSVMKVRIAARRRTVGGLVAPYPQDPGAVAAIQPAAAAAGAAAAG